jgi:nicotinamide-nucleotide amidase
MALEFLSNVPYNPARPHMAESLPQNIGALLRARQLKLATAESCTGGLVGDLITNVPGSSEYFLGGVIAYAYEAKTGLLGVPSEVLLTHGAVSEETARAMARGVRQRLEADVSVAVTGILGPGGATPTKPVGLFFIALLGPDADWCRRYVWDGNRLENKRRSGEAALQLLEEYLEGTRA